MSWYQDPQLFICNADHTASSGFNVYRCLKELSGSLQRSDLQYLGNGLTRCLSLGDKKESDFGALLAYLINSYISSGYKVWRIVNCQGLAVIWDQSTCGKIICSWSREPLHSPYYSLPGIAPSVDPEKEALRRRVSDLQAEISPLRAEVQRNTADKNILINEKKALEKINSQLKDEKQDLQKQVSELTSKLKECGGAGGGSADDGTWKSGNSTVPNNGVLFDDLDVQNFIPRNTSLKIIKAPGALKFVEDNTTNVRASRFYGGIHLVAVKMEELIIPSKDEAKFDATIWGSYNYAGKSYAIRKLFKSEM